MAAVTDLTSPLDLGVAGQQTANGNGEALPQARLLTVRDIEEDEKGATLRFLQGGHGRLAKSDPTYTTYLQLAQRSQARQHPVGVCFAEGHGIAELFRADNDIPVEWLDDGYERARVRFAGHDGVHFVTNAHPEFARLQTVIDDAIKNKLRVWFVARKPNLILADILAIKST